MSSVRDPVPLPELTPNKPQQEPNPQLYSLVSLFTSPELSSPMITFPTWFSYICSLALVAAQKMDGTVFSAIFSRRRLSRMDLTPGLRVGRGSDMADQVGDFEVW